MCQSPAQLISSSHPPIVIIALCLLTFGQLQAETAPEPAGVSVLLIEALQSDDSYVRQNAALAFERLQPEAAAPVLLIAIASDDPYVRQKAALALDRLAPEAAPPVLLAALDSDDTFVRQQAAKSLITIAGGAPVDVMRAALLNDDPGVRHHAALALENLGPQNLVPVMSIALESDDPAVRHKAAKLLSTQDPNAWQNTWHLLIPTEPAPPVAAPPPLPAPRRHPPSPWRSERYLGWEHKWSASWPYIMDDVMEDEIQLRYNRVEGPFLGWQLSRAYHGKTGLAHFGHGGYGFGDENWQFQTGGEIYTFYGPPETQSHLATIGAEIHDVSDSQDGWLISEEENSVSALLMRRDFLDYYRRFGWSAYTAHNVGGILHMTVKYGRDEFESQTNSVSWALHDTRFSRDDFRPNPAVVEGVVSSARVDVQLDTRNSRRNPWQGWFINGLFERAGGVLQGDHTFKRYVLDLRRYQPVSLGTRLDLRLRTGTAKEDLLTQYLYDLGGISTLRGYRFKEFSGDRMVLLNLEYWVDTNRHWHNHMPMDDLGFGVFFDVGSAWFANDASDPFERVSEPELKRSFGFGLGDKNQDFRFDLARPLDGDDESWHFLLRFGRSF